MNKYLAVKVLVCCLLMTSALADTTKLKNELGFTWDESYISDLKSWWTYGSGYYYHDFSKVKLGAKVNHGVKFATSGQQYQIEAYPKILDIAYLSLTAATASNNQIIYPSFQYSAELYFNVLDEELSLGQYGNVYSMFEGQKFFTYTGSAGIYYGDYFFWLRLNLYSFQHSNFWMFGIKKYYNGNDSYQNIALTFNAGSMPDIGDLPPLDQMIVMNQIGVSLNGSNLIYKSVYFKWLIAYSHQLYPNHHVRNVTDLMLGLAWRF